MTLTSLSFFAYVLAAVIVYYVCPKKWRYLALLAASIAFYAVISLKYLPFLLFTAFSTWAGALWLCHVDQSRKEVFAAHKAGWDREQKKTFKHQTILRKRGILALVLVVNFGILGVLKYYNFLADWLSGLFQAEIPLIGILLPLGISFYTFQSMGYLIDCYWEKFTPEKNPLKFLLFVTFFPQIVQGPIGTYAHLMPQLMEGHVLSFENLRSGFQLILWGLFKKMVIADRLIVPLNALLPVKNDLSNAWSLLLVLIYIAQLYMDFSGGIDLVRGVAQLFGITMAENFRRPFFSKSVAEFWRRWHISLCNWLKTYLFYPMAVSKAFLRLGSRIGRHGKKPEKELPEDSLWGGYTFFQHLGRVLPGCIGTLIVFFIIGMWHGANWKYAGYGIWNGLIILISMILEPVLKWLVRHLHIRVDTTGWRVWQILRTFFLVGLSFAFDIAYSLSDAVQMIGRCLTPAAGPNIHVGQGVSTGLETADWVVAALGLLLVFGISLYQERSKRSVRESIAGQSAWVSWALTLGCFTAVLVFGMYGPGIASGEFVYMQF